MAYYAYVLFKDDDTYDIVNADDIPVVAKLKEELRVLREEYRETHETAKLLKDREENLEAETEYLKMKIKEARKSARALEHALRSALPKNESGLSD